MKTLILLLLTTLCLLGSDAILKIDTFGHHDLIRDVIVTKDKKIITASDDKTIRIWNSETLKEERKILGEIGRDNGKIYAIALSSDEKYLAAGGFILGSGSDSSRAGVIRIYDFRSGKLLHILKSHTNIVTDLAFDESGNLYSASADKSAKVWRFDGSSFSLAQTTTNHTNEVNGIVPLDNGVFVTVGNDNKIFHSNGKNYTHKDKLEFVATNGSFIATCGFGNEILIFDRDLNYLKIITSPTVPAGLAFSSDGSKLIAGAKTNPNKVIVYDVEKSFRELADYTLKNLAIGVGFLDNNTAISAGGSNKEITIWDINKKKESSTIVGDGQQIWRVGIRANTIGFGHSYAKKSQNERGPIEKVFDLDTLSFSSNLVDFKLLDSSGLTDSQGGDYGYSDAVLNLPDGAKIVRNTTDGARHRAYGWAGEYVISSGAGGAIIAYDKTGQKIANFVGHTGEVWSIAIEGDTMVSGGTDQIIHFWDLKKLQNNEKTMYPKFSLFVAKNNEWVLWNQSGYYACSAGGDRYIGWHVNQGSDKEALFYPVAKFKSRYYNPELIGLMVGGSSEAEALAQLGKKVQSVSIADSLPPFITPSQFPEVTTDSGELSLKVRVISKNSDILGYKYLFNGRPLENTRALKPSVGGDGSITLNVTVPKERGNLSIIAQNKYGFSDPADFTITYTGGEQSILKPKLYVLSIGVGAYNDKELTLDFPAKDARDFSNVWLKQNGKFYKEVVTKVLTDKDASKDNILDALEWIQRETTARDVAVIFIAGHGLNDDGGQFYYLPVDINIDKIKRSGVPFSEFKNTLSSISGKVILFADACHSGNIMGKRRAVDNTSLTAELNDAENGVVYFSSSTGKQYSLEDKAWQNGAFTKAVVEGLSGKADLFGKGKMTVDSLSAYVSERVKELTKGRQTPTMGKPDTISDFPIGVK